MQLERELEIEFKKFVQRIGSDSIDRSQIRRAFEFAALAHNNQYRLSGEPYVLHCLAVAEIVSDYSKDTITLQATLLHDVCRDAGIPIKTIEKEN